MHACRSTLEDPTFIDLIFDAEDPDRPEATDNALDTLHDYVHFRLDAGVDLDEWGEAHDDVEEAIGESSPVAAALAEAITESREIDPEAQRAALAGTRVVGAVTELLAWIGKGRPVTQTGAVRRADIEAVSAMLGVAAIGVAKRTPVEVDPLGDVSQPETIRALSMGDVPQLTAWWNALSITDLIETSSTRVWPGPAAAEWLADSIPPLELAEMLVGTFVADMVTGPLGDSALTGFEATLIAETIRLLTDAVAPGLTEPDDESVPEVLREIVGHLALGVVARLADVGLLTGDASAGTAEVPVALRGAVAKGLLLALAYISGVDGLDEEDEFE